MGLEIVAVTDEGLGHSAHLVAVDGDVLVIDPLRVVTRYFDTIERNGWRLRWTADTHLHADYVSGGPELSARGAAFFAPGEAALEIPHRPLRAAIWTVAALTAASGVIVMIRMYETLHHGSPVQGLESATHDRVTP